MGPWITRVYRADGMGKAMRGANARARNGKPEGQVFTGWQGIYVAS